MLEKMNEYPTITGFGFYVPEQIWDNSRIEQMVDTTDEWIRSRTGIQTRHIASDDETTATLGSEAARLAIKDAGLHPLDLDMIIVATMSPEMPFPATAFFLANSVFICSLTSSMTN